MGLLDDAIKEHLDLKRRHGADPGEVAKQESEALGPVRREVEPVDPENLPAATPFDAEEDHGREPADDAGAEAPEAEKTADPVGQPTEHFDVLAEDPKPDAPAESEELFAPGEEPFADEPEATAAPASEESAGSEDVLEETPEFLQETPEHDRLWFEQKPPKDFDFDD